MASGQKCPLVYSIKVRQSPSTRKM